jgi:hypothetical protein
VSPVYFGDNVIWHIPPNQKVYVNDVARASFRRYVAKFEFKSALIYKLQRKKRLEYEYHYDTDSTSTKDTLTNIQLLVMWRSDDRYNFSVRVLLIKHSITITWDEDTLEKLYHMHVALLKDARTVKDTWLLDDMTALITKANWEEESRSFKIAISEGTRKDNSMEPLWVPSNM